VILKIKEIPDRNAAELLRNAELYVDRENAIELSEGEYFIADLIGLDVYTDEDKKLGSLYDVLKTGANDVYVIKTDEGKEILIPVIEDCIKKVDLEAKRVTVHLLKGLLED
ncbi:MAG: 16S rRNA processing protein RimM, partial [Lachnospiraceae bacterium]|nr:16S rRNA processing protein RimM [Lachnospiraceae bacterium]